MNIKKALVCLGALVGCSSKKSEAGAIEWVEGKTSYILFEEGVGNIIINKKDGKMLIVPFSEIIESLESK